MSIYQAIKKQPLLTDEKNANFKNNRYEKEWFSESILVDFEEYKFRAPIGYHEILIKMYGDYMQLPPEEKRVTHHINNAFWKDEKDEEV